MRNWEGALNCEKDVPENGVDDRIEQRVEIAKPDKGAEDIFARLATFTQWHQ